jgi:hypothetical protein
MMKREPGFMGLAKQNARKEQMLQIPKRWTPQGGEEEYPAFVTQKEMAMLKQQGGSGQMSPYGIPSFDKEERSAKEKSESQTFGEGVRESAGVMGRNIAASAGFGRRSGMDSGGGGGGYVAPESGGGGGNSGYTPPPPKTPEQIEAERVATAKGKYDEGNKKREEGQQGKTWDRERKSAVRGTMKDAEGRTVDQQGVMTDASGKVEGDEGFDFETATLQGGYDESTGKMDTSDSYEGYKQEAKGLGKDAKGLTEGVMTDASGKTEGQEGYDASSATMQGGFAGDVKKLGAYQSKFDQMGTDAKTRGDAGEKFQQEQGVKYSDEAGKGQTAATDAAAGIKTATAQGQAAAQTGVAAAGQGATGFQEGATDVGAVKDQFGQEGFQQEAGGYQSQIGAMADKAMSGDVGQSQAAMLKGQMEEGRMASQKGSEEKLRRSMAQSGASPAEIASKVAQFQQSSAGQQAQAGRSEALSSQLQGQQMGQAQLGQAAGLTGQAAGMLGQKAGMAGQQASLGAQQAALRGQAAGMQMQGAQMGMSGAQMGMQGAQQAGQMGMQGAQMGMQGAQGNAAMNAQGNQIGMAGANQQASMMGQGMGAVQAAGGARQQQMGGLDQQGGFIDQQGQYTQAQLNDTMDQQTQAYSTDEAEKTRRANAAANSGGGGGGGGGFLSKLGISDIRLKDNITLLKKGKEGDPNIYSFNYIWDSKTLWSGVMAQELLDTKHTDAVKTHPDGYYMVDYGKLDIEMIQLSTKEQHGI